MPTTIATIRTLRLTGKTRRVRCDSSKLPLVEKDILRVGHWKPAGESWHVSPKTLRNICEQFTRYRAAGNRVPWIVDHEGGAGQRIGDVISLRVDGDTLVARCQVTDKRYAMSFGDKPGDVSSQEVSVEVHEPWEDGAGNHYPIALTHLANVINPVIPGQQPFRRVLSLRKVRRMADETPVDDGEGGGGNVSFANVVAMLEKYFEVTVPDSVTDEATLDAFLAGLITTPGEATETEPTEEAPAEVPAEAAPMYMSLKTKTKKIEADNAELRRRLSVFEKSQKDAFHAEINALIEENYLTPADGKEIAADADKAKVYSMASLKPFRRLAKNAVHTGGVARRLGAGATENKGKDSGDAVKARQDALINGVFKV